MPFADFSQFAHALCRCAGIATPQLEPDGAGVVAFHLVIQEVVVDVFQLPALGGEPCDDAFVAVTFGSIAQGMELDALQVMAEANYAMLGHAAPVFGMNPATGEVVMRQHIGLSRVDAQSAFDSIVRLTGIALRWRADPTLAPDEPSGNAVDVHRLA